MLLICLSFFQHIVFFIHEFKIYGVTRNNKNINNNKQQLPAVQVNSIKILYLIRACCSRLTHLFQKKYGLAVIKFHTSLFGIALESICTPYSWICL